MQVGPDVYGNREDVSTSEHLMQGFDDDAAAAASGDGIITPTCWLTPPCIAIP